MTAPPVRFGILGAGEVARGFAAGLRTVPDARLVSVASRTPSTAQSFQRDFPGVSVAPSYAALLEDPDVDVVYIATPHHLHAAQTIAALEAGKHALCEKPFTLDASEARAVVDVARRTGRFCMEAMWMRFMPVVLRARELVDGGAIGDPRLLHADFGVATAVDPSSRFYDPALGGGALLDRGVYGVSLATMLFGQPIDVVGLSGLSATGVDEHTGIVLEFEHARLAVVSCSLSSYTSNTASISGTHGKLTIEAPFFCPARLHIERYSPSEPGPAAPASGSASRLDAVRRTSVGRFAIGMARPIVRRSRRKSVRIPLDGNGYGYEAAEVVRCLTDGLRESPLMPLDASVAIMEILDRVRSVGGEAR